MAQPVFQNLNTLIQVDKVFKETKRILGKASLAAKQMRKIRQLQLTVNRDSVNVAEKYLRINTTGQEHRGVILDWSQKYSK